MEGANACTSPRSTIGSAHVGYELRTCSVQTGSSCNNYKKDVALPASELTCRSRLLIKSATRQYLYTSQICIFVWAKWTIAQGGKFRWQQILEIAKIYESWAEHVTSVREDFDIYENGAFVVKTGITEYKETTTRKMKRKILKGEYLLKYEWLLKNKRCPRNRGGQRYSDSLWTADYQIRL
ncbi:hypothetical protein HELRODRAFT_188327 [Helobdella robusta]|uniref:Uncharacterized protein n=1 Tax=Helobdella robusta TaxID=6412 RepID=T1FPW0_HELRO|nr:hypothetical protein HELRODRAFT_188327 [Helobdella robusta]ESO06320.1 hypothetical protein HELRODRAFT_188327 [Helobdella robusta]